MVKRYLLYLLRWQLSTPILAVCVSTFVFLGNVWATVIANLIGGLIFFWIDRLIFSRGFNGPVWEIRDRWICADCGKESRGYRLVWASNYDRRNDPTPEYRCEECSAKKLNALKASGVVTE